MYGAPLIRAFRMHRAQLHIDAPTGIDSRGSEHSHIPIRAHNAAYSLCRRPLLALESPAYQYGYRVGMSRHNCTIESEDTTGAIRSNSIMTLMPITSPLMPQNVYVHYQNLYSRMTCIYHHPNVPSAPPPQLTHQTLPSLILPHRDSRNTTMTSPCLSLWKLLLCSVLISLGSLTSASYIPTTATGDHMLIDTILEPKNGTVWTPKSTATIAWKTCAPSPPLASLQRAVSRIQH